MQLTNPARLSDAELPSSPVVANRHMNRQRGCTGVNSYQRELGLDPIAWLRRRLEEQGTVAWLDLCCGEGKALIEASAALPGGQVTITGIDLVRFFDGRVASCPNVQLVVGALLEIELEDHFDLITCVHGLHYVGDKLAALFRYSALLNSRGLMIANFDTRDILGAGGQSVSRQLNRLLREAGCEYDGRKRILRAERKAVSFPFTYLGADDRMGPNYTRQDTVRSFYDLGKKGATDQ